MNRIFFILSCIALFAFTGFTTMQASIPLKSGKVQRIDGDSREAIYATGSNGLSKYWIYDLGREWNKTEYLSGVPLNDFLIIKNDYDTLKILAVTSTVQYGDQLMISEDGGENFVDITPTFLKESSDATISHICSYMDGYASCYIPKDIFLSCTGGNAGLYHSPDFCKSWIRILEGTIDFFTTYTYEQYTMLVAGYTDENQVSHVCTSIDDGRSWETIYEKSTTYIKGIDICWADRNAMCLYGDNLFFTTTDGGLTWQENTPSVTFMDAAFKYGNINEVYAAANEEEGAALWYSADLGCSWEKVYIMPSDNIIDMHAYSYDIYCLMQSGRVYNLFHSIDGFVLRYDYESMFTTIRPLYDSWQSLYYDLQGRPVANPTRGIYIKDGKKVIIGQ